MKKTVIALILCAVSSTAIAETVPSSHKLDPRIRDATYIDGQVYRVHTSLLRTTTIEFPAGEVLNNLVAGDTEALQFTSIPGGRVVAIKPVVRGLNTNITLYTNRRAYYLNVVEKPNATYFAVRFNGGYTLQDSTMPDAKAVQAKGTHMGYGANIKTAITPTKIWDDGVYTYFSFYETSPIPAIFKTITGQEMTVNSTVLGNQVVRVSGISNYWILRSGEMEVVIKRYNPAPVGVPVSSAKAKPVIKQNEARYDR